MSATPRDRVRAYIAAQSPAARKALRQMRALIRATALRATDAFSYRIPAFQLDGRPFVWYAGFTHHTSLFPMGEAIRRANATALEGYGTSKGTVRFPLERPLPVALVKRLLRARLAEVRVKTGKAKPRKARP